MCCVSPPKQDEIPAYTKPRFLYYGEGTKKPTTEQFISLLADKRS